MPPQKSLTDIFLNVREGPRANRKSDLTVFANWNHLAFNELEGFLFTAPGASKERAEKLLVDYSNHLVEAGLTKTTVSRHISTIRAFVKMAFMLGICSWTIDKKISPKNVKGIGDDVFDAILTVLHARIKRERPEKAIQDLAIVRVVHDLAIRRERICRLDLSDFDIDEERLRIGKDTALASWTPLPTATAQALKHWLTIRKTDQGPLFLTFEEIRPAECASGNPRARPWDWLWVEPTDKTLEARRFTTADVYRLIRQLGKAKK